MAIFYLFIWFIQLSLLFSIGNRWIMWSIRTSHILFSKGRRVARDVILIPMVSCTFVHMSQRRALLMARVRPLLFLFAFAGGWVICPPCLEKAHPTKYSTTHRNENDSSRPRPSFFEERMFDVRCKNTTDIQRLPKREFEKELKQIILKDKRLSQQSFARVWMEFIASVCHPMVSQRAR